MMHLSVMGVVEVIFTWVLQCINGGVLNVFFTPELNQTTNKYDYKFLFDSKKLVTYIRAVLLLKGEDLPLGVLKTFPVSLGGGAEGVKLAQENPNREVYFIAGSLGVALIMLIAIIGLLFISFCTCCMGKKIKKSRDQHQNYTVKKHEDYYQDELDSDVDSVFKYNASDHDADGNSRKNLRGLFYNSSVFDSQVEERQAEILDGVEELMEKSSFKRKHQVCSGCHLVSLILAIIYIAALLICIVIYLMAAQQLAQVMEKPPKNETTVRNNIIAWTNGTSTHFNFPATVTFILREVVNLLEDGVNNLLATMKSTIDGLTTTLEPTIDKGVNNTFESLIQIINITDLFNQTQEMAVKLIDLKKHVVNINDNFNATVPQLIRLNAEFKAIHTEVKRQQPNLGDLNLIDFNFNGGNVHPLVGADYIQKFVDDFVAFAKQLDSLKAQLNSMPIQVIDQIKKQLDLSKYYTQIESQVNVLVKRIKPQMEDIAKTVPQYIEIAQPYIAPALYAPAGIITIIAISFFICLILFITEACRFRLFSITGKGPSELASIEKLRQRSRACSGCRFCMCSFLLIFVVILAILAAVIMVISSFLAAEFCPYVSIVKGINQSDYILNSYVNQQWPPIQNELLDMPAPSNVLFAIDTTCNPVQSPDPKLLPSIGVGRITNLTKLSEDPTITDKFTGMGKNIADTISKSIDPNILKTMEQLRQMKQLLEQFLRAVEAVKAVAELSKFTTVDIDKLWNLQRQVQDTEQARKLASAIHDLQTLMPKTQIVQSGYQGLTQYSILPKELEDYLNLAKGILENLMNTKALEGIIDAQVTPAMYSLLIHLLNLGDASVNSITEKVLPCSNIHYIVTSLIATGCSNSGLNNRFFGWALALILAVLFSFLSFVGLFNLWCFQSRQIRRFYGG